MKITKVPKKFSQFTLLEYQEYLQEMKDLNKAFRIAKKFNLLKNATKIVAPKGRQQG